MKDTPPQTHASQAQLQQPASQTHPALGDISARSAHARALAALGHDARLLIFRLLVKAGDEGLRVGDLAVCARLAPSTLAHHMRSLRDAGLVIQEKRGREVWSRVDFPAMNRVLDFLTEECCAGLDGSCGEDQGSCG